MSDANNENAGLGQAETQVRSIEAIVAALELDWDRLEELRDKRAEGCYIASWSVAGESKASHDFASAQEARFFLEEEMEDRSDNVERADPMLAQALRAAARELRESTDDGADAGLTRELGGVVYSIRFEANRLADPVEGAELAHLEEIAGECSNEEDARQQIQEDPLSVEVRSDWHSPHDTSASDAAEFRMVLMTGGPHVELVGELEHGEPCSVRVLYSDWFKSRLEYLGDYDREAVLTYCRQFYFAE